MGKIVKLKNANNVYTYPITKTEAVYIEDNKTTLKDYLDATAIIKTVGPAQMVTFNDGANNIPVKSCIISLEPYQEGSGDPSPTNVRPISGRTGLTVTAVGKSLLENNWGGLSRTQNGLSITIGNDGIITVNGTATAGGVIIANFGVANSSTANQNWRRRALPNGTYRFVGTGGGFNLQVRGTNEEAGNADTPIAASNVSDTFTIDDTYKYNWIRFQFSNGATGTNKKLAFMIVPVGMTYDTYEPYTGTTIPITWESIAGTIYGGTLNVTTGVLTVDMAIIDMGDMTWNYSSNDYFYSLSIRDAVLAPSASGIVTTAICSLYKPVATGQIISHSVDNAFGIIPANDTNHGRVWVRDTSKGTSAADFKTAVTGQKIVYPLATPTTYQLTPTEVKTLLGGNSIFTDAGSISVDYIADIKLYIDNKVAGLQALASES